MKRSTLIIFLIAIFQICSAQSVDYNLFEYKRLSFYSAKSEIEKKLGKPLKIYEPNYECGFLSSHEQSANYFSLDYDKVIFTGNEKEKYLLEFIYFKDKSTILKYSEYSLTSETTIDELAKIFGKEIYESLKSNNNRSVFLAQENADDGIFFRIKDGKLYKIEYWSPC